MTTERREFVLIGDSGNVVHRLAGLLCASGADVTFVGTAAPRQPHPYRISWVACDPLTEEINLPPGRVVVLIGGGDPPRRPWQSVLDIAVPTARLLKALDGRDVVLPEWSGAECESDVDLAGWCSRLAAIAEQPCDPSTVAALCRELAGSAPADLAMRRARAAQHALLSAPGSRLADLTLIPLQELGRELLAEDAPPRRESADAVEPLFHPPIPVVIPPRPVLPDVVAQRQQRALWSGQLKAGNEWSMRCQEELRERLQLDDAYELLLTTSGTAALELAIVAAAGPAAPGAVALVPSFTFRATIDVLLRLGYGIRYVDVDAFTWTLDAAALATALEDERVRLVVCVDTFGNPCAYEDLGPLCAARGIALVADSAAGFGSSYQGRPVGQQAAAHSFSMSFAKVLTAAGAGGAMTFRRDQLGVDLSTWTGSQLMSEMHAIAALDQLAVLDELVAVRNEVAAGYASAVQDVAGVSTQRVVGGNVHSYVHWVARVPDRDALAARLAELGVLTKPYFPAQHRHHPVAKGAERLPVSEQLDTQALAFPTSSELSVAEVRKLRHALQIALGDLVAAGWPEHEAARDA
ncbi:MAG TPA: DegT/DnrJ/EryC1/StrS family aminotransferase [Frankiaceae bacterium]|jgi:dTDP-4-amino-4,6-dideoxygalactose transaminase|nr:DegT/DnrJ/EryC1/StrS family aminotransferase [Frankiaceae bacterium]